MRNFVTLFTLLLFLSTCSDDTARKVEEVKVFFSLEDYFSAEAKRLNDQPTTVLKRITMDEKAEEQTLSNINFEQELAIFRNADINRIAWADKYQADSVYADGQLHQIRYERLDSTLKTALIVIDYAISGDIVSIDIETATNSALANNRHQLHYAPNAGYSVETRQENQTGAALDIKVEGLFE